MKSFLANFKSKSFWLKVVLAILLVCLFFMMMPGYSFVYDSLISCLIFLAFSIGLDLVILSGFHQILNKLYAKYPNVTSKQWKIIYFIVAITAYALSMSIVDFVMSGVALSMTAILIFSIILSLDKVKRLQL
ncbi:MAG: hypothetical protein J6F30_06825 [Cellulosilyticum sp.]|nr:hypothetical protein [Cellulosilyticum sp.]